eukprot:scaffold407_cov251-Pinguiococcus_pyrenoidosus.AAC.31
MCGCPITTDCGRKIDPEQNWRGQTRSAATGLVPVAKTDICSGNPLPVVAQISRQIEAANGLVSVAPRTCERENQTSHLTAPYSPSLQPRERRFSAPPQRRRKVSRHRVRRNVAPRSSPRRAAPDPHAGPAGPRALRRAPARRGVSRVLAQHRRRGRGVQGRGRGEHGQVPPHGPRESEGCVAPRAGSLFGPPETLWSPKRLVFPAGVKYAPWMDIDEFAVEKVREVSPRAGEGGKPRGFARLMQVLQERAAKRRAEKKRAEGQMWADLSAGELSGIGLKKRFVDDKVSEAAACKNGEWGGDLRGTRRGTGRTGVDHGSGGRHRRLHREQDPRRREELADGGVLQGLAAAALQGTEWRHLHVSHGTGKRRQCNKCNPPDESASRLRSWQDPTTELGSWYYRVTEENKNGGKADVCQLLVDVQSDSEKLAGKIAVLGFAGVVAALIAATSFIDPMQ